MKKNNLKLFNCLLSVFLIVFLFIPVKASDYYSVDVGYQGLSNGIWTDFAYGGALAGTENGEALDSFEIHLVDAPFGAEIEYRVFTVSGWGDWSLSFKSASNSGQAILGAQIQLKDFPNANVYYQSYRKDLGWGKWVSNGTTTGELKSAHPITGFRVKVDEIGVSYKSNVIGTPTVLRHNGETQGTGSLDTLSIFLNSTKEGQGVEYRAFLRGKGWTNWASNGVVVGSNGSIIEAIEAKLINLPQYSIQIQPQVEGEWWDFTYDGQQSGSIGSRLTGYRIKIVQRVNNQLSQNELPNENDTDDSSTLCQGIGDYEFRFRIEIGTSDYEFEYLYQLDSGEYHDDYVSLASYEDYESIIFNQGILDTSQQYFAMHGFFVRFTGENYLPQTTDHYDYCFGTGFDFYDFEGNDIDIPNGSNYLKDAEGLIEGTSVHDKMWVLYAFIEAYNFETESVIGIGFTPLDGISAPFSLVNVVGDQE